MNIDSYRKSGTVRQAIAAVFIATVLAVALLLIFGLRPLQREQARCRDELYSLDSEMFALRSADGAEDLDRRLARAEIENARMKAVWNDLRPRVRTFDDDELLENILAASQGGRIDYKVALYNVRQWIEYESLNNTSFPPTLGMRETVGTDEIMELKLWHLAANVKLAEVIIASGIEAVESVSVPEPILRTLTIESGSHLLLYPLSLQMKGSYSSLLDFMHNIAGAQRFFAPMRMMVATHDTRRPEIVSVRAVCAALAFRDELPAAETEIAPPDEEQEIDQISEEEDLT
jgi:hypothetical protein